MLPKKFRLPAKEFGNVYRNGKKYRGEYGMLVCSPNRINNPRIGFVVSKKIGNAVFRHRFTRLLRVVFMDIIKEKGLGSLSMDFQYVGFKFCNEYSVLRSEVSNKLEEVVNV